MAGNFAGHLDQAGEAGDFAAVDAAAGAPKGIFPFYTPHGEGFLSAYPLSHERIALPRSDTPLNLQIEPEVGLFCRVEYADGAVKTLHPTAIAAFNDCSIRRPGAQKISEKKNWGPDSKGVADNWIALPDFERDGALASFRLAGFLRRADELHEYGVDSPLPGYSYFGEQLLDWIVDRLGHQRDDGPLEDVGAMLAACGEPDQMLIGIGATRYTAFGEETFLEPGDDAIVVIYDSDQLSAADLRAALSEGRELPGAGEATSSLVQRVGP